MHESRHYDTGSIIGMNAIAVYKNTSKNVDVITSDDFQTGIIEKQSPNIVKTW